MAVVSEFDDNYPGIQPEYLLAEKAVVGSTCVFPTIGALFVSCSYDHETGFKWKEMYFKFCCGYEVKDGNGKDGLIWTK